MKHIEESLQTSCINWLTYQYPDYACYMHHSPNGGKRNAREAGRFKAMGTRPGFPDLFLPLRRGRYSGLAIEMKAPKGKVTEAQSDWLTFMASQGYQTEICRSFEEFKAIVDEYMHLPLNHQI